MLKLAIDFGMSTTKIYKIGSGIVLSEPTCVSVQRDTGEILSFGAEAKEILGKTSDSVIVKFPVFEGDIDDERLAAALLEYYLSKVVKRGLIDALFCVPCGCSIASREKYYRVAKSVGISRVSFAESPRLAVLGQDVPLSESNPVFAIDIGAGKTSAAVFSLGGVIAGFTLLNVGGHNMDVDIIDCIAEKMEIKIGLQTSERLKNAIGSLIPNDNQSFPVNGRNVRTGHPQAKLVYSGDVLQPIKSYVDTIVKYAQMLLKKLPAEVSAAMCKNGVYLSGGVCCLAGVADYIAQQLQTEAHLASDPVTAVVLGGGRAIGNQTLLHKIRMA